MTKILVVGAGTMGHGIAQVFATGGHPVQLVDIDEGILEGARNQIRANLEVMVEADVLPQAEVAPALDRIETGTDLESSAGSIDFAIECVPEQAALKREILGRLEAACPPHVVLASNTSSLDIFALAKLRRPESLCIVHWYAPPHIIPLVDVVKSPPMPEETCADVMEMLRRLGKRPVLLKKFVPGYIVNRLQFAMSREMNFLLDNELVTPEELDESVKASLAPRMMALGLAHRMDFTGLDVSLAIQKTAAERPAPAPTYDTLARLVGAGRLGVKTGQGFYDYGGKTQAEINRERDLALFKILNSCR